MNHEAEEGEPGQLNLFTSRLDQILNPEHPLVILADKIDWSLFENRMGRCFLKGLPGDALNAVLAVAGANFRKLMNCFLLFSSLFSRGQIAGCIREMADVRMPGPIFP